MSKYLPQEKYANVTLTRDVSTGGWYGCNTSWGVYNSSTRSDNKKSNGGQISTTFSYTHTYINNINDFIAGCLWSTNNKQTVLTISSGGEVVLPTGLQTLIDNTIQYYYSSYKFIYAIQSSDAFKYGGDWAYCDVSYHRYIWNYYATYFTIYRAKKSQIVYSNLSLANEYNAGDATGRDSNEGRSTFGMSVWIRDQNNNIMTAYSKYAKGGHWYDAGGWLSHVDFNTAIENRAVFTW
jgi:hypothetical protein